MALMGDGERGGAGDETAEGGQRDHGFRRRRDRRGGRCAAPTAVGQLVGVLIACLILRDRGRAFDRLLATRLDGGPRHRSRDGVGVLGATDPTARRADEDLLEHLGALPVARRDLHDHVVLVERMIDRRRLALAEGVIERIVDLACGEAEPRGGGAIDGQRGLEALVPLIGTDVDELGRVLQRLRDPARPRPQLAQVVGLERVLVLRAALPAADPNVLCRLKE